MLQQQEHSVANINPVGSEFAVVQFSMLRRLALLFSILDVNGRGCPLTTSTIFTNFYTSKHQKCKITKSF